MLKIAILAAALTMLCFGSVVNAAPHPATDIRACLHFKGHVYEACFAYVVNDSSLALRNYYRLANSRSNSRAADASEDLHYRYRGAALSLVLHRTARWPRGENIVGLPRITILDASASLVSDTATLITRESWRVSTNSGRVLYKESSRLHHVTMARVQGKFLHVWVVASIS